MWRTNVDVIADNYCREHDAHRLQEAERIVSRVYSEAFLQTRSAKEAEGKAAEWIGIKPRRVRAWRAAEIFAVSDTELCALREAERNLITWRKAYHRAELARAEAEEQQLVARIQAGREALRTGGLVAMVRPRAEHNVGRDFQSVGAAGSSVGVVPPPGRGAR